MIIVIIEAIGNTKGTKKYKCNDLPMCKIANIIQNKRLQAIGKVTIENTYSTIRQ